MELTINGETFSEEVTRCEFTEYAAARCDALQLSLNDENSIIREMNLKKGDIVEAEAENVKSGTMYISEIEYVADMVMIRALSTKLACFREKSFYRESISFYEMVKEVAEEIGYNLNLVNSRECTYIDITRVHQNPISYLTERLRLEGYQLRISNDTLIIYDEKEQENKESVEDYSEEDFSGNVHYSTKDANLIESVKNTYRTDDYTIKTFVSSGLEGKNIDTSLAVSSIAESERFSKGIMREANKYEYLSSGYLEGLERRVGQNINLDCSLSDFNGKNYIYIVKHDFVLNKQKIYMRKPIAGDY